MSLSFAAAVFVSGFIVAMIALILVETFARWLADFDGHLVGPYDSECGDADTYLRQLRKDWPGIFDEQDIARRAQS
jgi:hypothetical protein